MSRARNRRARNRRPLNCESLENRVLMAGDVDVALDADKSDLLIMGDNAANEIVIEQIDQKVVVSGENGTKINGWFRPAVFKVPGLTKAFDDITVDVKGGDDKVTIRDVAIDHFHHSDLIAKLGSGNDVLWINGVRVGRDVDVDPGTGRNTVAINRAKVGTAALGGNIQVTSNENASSLDVLIDNSSGSNITVDGGDVVRVLRTSATQDIQLESRAGNSGGELLVEDSSAGDDIRLYGADGNDSLRVAESDAGDDVGMYGRGGNDDLTAFRTQADDLWIFGGDGDDFAVLSYTSVHDYLYASLGEGEDTLLMFRSGAGRHYLNGGSGRDALDHGTWWTFLNRTSFEFSTPGYDPVGDL